MKNNLRKETSAPARDASETESPIYQAEGALWIHRCVGSEFPPPPTPAAKTDSCVATVPLPLLLSPAAGSKSSAEIEGQLVKFGGLRFIFKFNLFMQT